MLRKLLLTSKNNYLRLCLQQPVRHMQQAASSVKSVREEYTLLPTQIEEAIKHQPKLVTVSPDLWQQAHDVFTNHGLKTNSFLQIVCSNPAILARPPQKIIQSIELWRSCQFGEKLLHLMLIKYPELFDITDERQLLPLIGLLQSYVGTTRNVWKLLMNSPDLLEQSEERIEEKFEYINKNMRIEIPEIVKSEALSKPLIDLQCRHVFLERLGMFKPRPLKSNPDEPTTNPRLYQISNTSDKTFATKICHIRLEEYEAFQDLFKKEQMRKQRNDDENDEDEDYTVDTSDSSDDDVKHKHYDKLKKTNKKRCC